MDLLDTIFIDNHAHSFLKGFLDLDLIGFRKCFSESSSMLMIDEHVKSSMHYLNMLNELQELVEFDSEDDLIDRRQRLDCREYTKRLWDDASIGAVLVDDGFMIDSMLSIRELDSVSGRPIFRVVRIESVLERLIESSSSIKEIERNLEAHLLEKSSNKIVGFKTIAAYRGGLEITLDVESARAESDFDDLKRKKPTKDEGPGRFRLERSPLYHYLLLRAMQIAGENNLPIQIHCGIGDSDLDLHKSNPSLLTPIFKSKRFSACRFVLLHCYPYVREAAYLCSVFPGVYMDLSLSVTLASMLARELYTEAMALAPSTKILAGTDGHSIPETHWYGALKTKKALSVVFEKLIADGYIDLPAAITAAENILFGNCRRLYDLDGLV